MGWMVLVVLFYKKIKTLSVITALFVSSLAFSRPVQTFEIYSRASSVVVKAITKAKKTVWVTTDFLSDGALVNALYLANLRRLDVKLLIKRSSVGQPLELSDYLAKRKVPVFYKENEGASKEVSAALVDDELILLNSSFHFRTKNTRFKIKYIDKKLHDRFREAFIRSSSNKRGQKVEPVVSSKESQSRVVRSGAGPNAKVSGSSSGQGSSISGGVFSYDNQAPQRTAPVEVQQKLPKLPIYMQKLLDSDESSSKGVKE